MAERISIKEGWESLKIIDEKMKETTKLMKESAEKLNNYTLSNLTSDRDASLQFSSIIEEQKQINHNIMSNMDYVSDKIHLIQNSVIGDPNNFGQVGTILDGLTELEHSILPDPPQVAMASYTEYRSHYYTRGKFLQYSSGVTL